MAPDLEYMHLALRLARRGFGTASPNPMVGAVVVKRGVILGRGWHHRAGEPHAEIEALADARKRGNDVRGATMYVTLEPCSTQGRTPPCVDTIIASGVRQVFIGAVDPNPRHSGRGLVLLRRAGIAVHQGLLSQECTVLNESFNCWIQHRVPFVTVKAAMTLDGKIATRSGESKWITGAASRAHGMKLRQGVDAVLVGINTVLADNPELTVRRPSAKGAVPIDKRLRRIVLDAAARTPVDSKVVSDAFSTLTTIVVGREAPLKRRHALAKRAHVLIAPSRAGRIDLRWLLKKLGSENITSLLVEGGGEVNASFLLGGFANRVAFFYAPKVLGGANARKAVAGSGARSLDDALDLRDVHWRKLGVDWLLTARVERQREPKAKG